MHSCDAHHRPKGKEQGKQTSHPTNVRFDYVSAYLNMRHVLSDQLHASDRQLYPSSTGEYYTKRVTLSQRALSQYIKIFPLNRSVLIYNECTSGNTWNTGTE